MVMLKVVLVVHNAQSSYLVVHGDAQSSYLVVLGNAQSSYLVVHVMLKVVI